MGAMNEAVKFYDVTIRGARLIMHNGRLADPLDPYTIALKEVTERRKKSFDDHIEVGRREFVGGLYWTKELGPYLPNNNIEACIFEGARKRKLGKEFAPSVSLVDDAYAVKYKGPRDLDGLWKDREHFVLRAGVVVGQSRVIRTRPIFRDWSVSFRLQLLPSSINTSTLESVLQDAGALVGLGDWSPKYGRFTVEKFAQVS